MYASYITSKYERGLYHIKQASINTTQKSLWHPVCSRQAKCVRVCVCVCVCIVARGGVLIPIS